MYYTYIIKCSNGNLYTGITTDVERRFFEHQSKGRESAKYTRANPAVSLEAVWSSSSRALASKLEYFIKTLSRKSKCDIVLNPVILNERYFEKIDVSQYQFEYDLVDYINKKLTVC